MSKAEVQGMPVERTFCNSIASLKEWCSSELDELVVGGSEMRGFVVTLVLASCGGANCGTSNLNE
jgi:hypothetical protein